MKKILLACFMALGIGANAQILLHESFEGGGTTYPGFTTTSLSNFTLTGSECESTLGKQALGRAVSASATTAVLEYASAASNGKKIDVSVNYQDWGATVGGNIKLEYAVGASTTFVAVPGTTTVAFTTQQNCKVIAGTIPEGTVEAGVAFKVRVTTTRTAGSFTALYDAIDIVQEVTAVPACTTFSVPSQGATNVSVRPTITWLAAAGAEYYKIKVGTAAGLSDVLSLQATGTSFTPAIGNVFPASTLLYASITPTNAMGDATGCASEITFTTGANPFAPYCGPIVSSVPASTFPISSVAFAGQTNTSSAANGAPAHESFTSTIFEVAPNSSNVISIVGTGSVNNRFATVIFIDWNNDGDFDDAGEKYFTATPFLYGFAAVNTLNGTITVPAGALMDTNLRMRVKYQYVGAANPTTLPIFLTDPCSDLGNGQAEDYTVIVKLPTTPPACAALTAPTNGSTGFASNGTFTWAPVSGAEGYKLYIGTSSGGTDVLNGTNVTQTSYQVNLAPYTMYYAKVVAYNAIGDATGCTETVFTTGSVGYCIPAPGYSTVEPTTNVTFAGINNTTSPTVGGTPAYEQFLDKIGTVVQGGTNYPISLNANTDGGSFKHFFAVFIDWNQDGDFDDEGEKYFTTVPTFISVSGSNGVSGAPATGTISVPENALVGQTRMRVKSAFYASTGPNTEPNLSNFANGCVTTGSSFGQVEDYTIQVNAAPAATVNVGKDKVSVYPNPFQDVLKISDVKGVRSISVSDVSGRQVKNMKPSAELNLSDLKTGMYIVTLNMEDGTVKSFKTIKK